MLVILPANIGNSNHIHCFFEKIISDLYLKYRLFFVNLRQRNQKTNLKQTKMNLGTPEIILIALVVLLLFGGKKIPELMKGLGKGVKSFKDGVKGLDDEVKEATNYNKEEGK